MCLKLGDSFVLAKKGYSGWKCPNYSDQTSPIVAVSEVFQHSRPNWESNEMKWLNPLAPLDFPNVTEPELIVKKFIPLGMWRLKRMYSPFHSYVSHNLRSRDVVISQFGHYKSWLQRLVRVSWGFSMLTASYQAKEKVDSLYRAPGGLIAWQRKCCIHGIKNAINDLSIIRIVNC